MSLCRRQFSVVLGGVLVTIAVASCGEGEPAGRELIDAYRERVIAAYEELEQDREEDFNQGVAGGDCFLTDEEGSTELGRTFTGDEREFAPTSQFTFGPPGARSRRARSSRPRSKRSSTTASTTTSGSPTASSSGSALLN